ncbi:hypothetical protein A3C32_03555 [Candidatus Daviesbacteria bacterium RIFCSPHIGHO2_02_FULL_41_14]|nr:MAG: hypothetical protein A2780_01325 [Candidatus Daviesbacteria bacterium RIFCSPHIGHO2_01_FULL_41_45]OGE35498.1 MAG: hypothetical protein A3C32_03555 [Candidatus Daviesbacteria bacterium RIFCSPHIGHO2_02_FULL_41_14]
MKKFLLYYSFILITIMTFTGFLSASSISQLISAVLFFPLTIFLWLRILPKKNRALIIPTSTPAKSPLLTRLRLDKVVVLPQVKLPGNFDMNRRTFLKLIGAAGLSLFFFSIFTSKAQAAFFGSAPGPGTVALKDTAGSQIDPAIKTPTDGYKISQIDDSGTASYYGFIDKDGRWFIMKDDGSGNYRYVKGGSDFTTNWGNRATSLTYNYFDVIF